MSAKIYKKLFIKTALKLFFAGTGFRFVNFTARLFFARARKPGRLLIFTDRLLNKKICECIVLHEKCEYFKGKLKEPDNKYAPV